MAIYHLSVKIISRSEGRSSVAAAAYRSASRLEELGTGQTHDHSRKRGVVDSGIEAPDGAPDWARDRGELWNQVETAERRKDAQLARDICLALPQELTQEEQRALLIDYLQQHFVRQGMVADWAIHHDNPDNPHAHVMLTMRTLGPKGFGQKQTAWNARTQLLGWRQGWAEASNRALALAGHDIAIDARSYAAQGLGIVPGIKIGAGRGGRGHDGRDIVGERLTKQAGIRRVNGEAILRSPTLATQALTRQQATFTERDAKRWLAGHTEGPAQAKAALDAVMGLPSLVPLSPNAQGEARWTTQEMLDAERRLLDHARALQARGDHARGVAPASASFLAANRRGLSGEQQAALRHVTGPAHLAVLEGYAGTGKSRSLAAAKVHWEAKGYRVQGAALAGIAAEGLEASSGIASRTLASFEARLETGESSLTSRDVLVVDEAGMVGTRQLERVLGAARDGGAKVVLVGDTAQLQAIEAGAPMRAVAQEVGAVRLTGVQRQTQAWQRQASVQLAEGKVGAALAAYDRHGAVQQHETQQGALSAVLQGWARGRDAAPEKSHAMLAYLRAEVDGLNAAAHDLRDRAGELGRESVVVTEQGPRTFSEGERVVFLRNDRALGVRNGTLGTLEGWDGSSLQIRLDGEEPRRVAVDMDRYRHVDYGYASTVHKSQGMTVDRAHVLASRNFDRHLSYVACTRHREKLEVHWSREHFGDERQFQQRMGRQRQQETALEAEPGANTSRGPEEFGQSGAAGVSAIERLRQAEVVACQSALTLEKATEQVPAVRACEAEVKEANRRAAHYAEQQDAYRQAHPILSRMPWGTLEVTDLKTGERKSLGACVRDSQQQLRVAQDQARSVGLSESVQKQAQDMVSKQAHQRTQATMDIPQLQEDVRREREDNERRIQQQVERAVHEKKNERAQKTERDEEKTLGVGR